MPKSFLIDTTRCTACRGCQLACKEWHNLPANHTRQMGTHQNPPDLNPYNLKIIRFREHFDDSGNVVWNFFPDQCRHCRQPICLEVANMWVPGAMVKDEKSGAVLVTEKFAQLPEKAANDVVRSCPYNVPRYDVKTHMLTKCDMCIDRVSSGLVPMCVKTCPTGAMVFGERKEILAEAEKRLAKVKKEHRNARLVDVEDVNVIYLLAEEAKYYYENASFG